MKISRLLATALSGALLASCGAVAPRTPAPAGALPHVLATETFLGDIAQNVAGNRIEVETLLSPGVDPHEYQLTPKDAIKIEQADVLLANGLGYETWLAKSLQASTGQRAIVVATDGLNPKPDPSGEHPEGDPHMWMSPVNVIHYVENIRAGLSRADPAGAAGYRTNTDDYIADLRELDGWIKGQVDQIPPEKRLLVTNHDALSYFAEDYGFKVVGAVTPGVSAEASPSAKQMADLIQTIKTSGAPAIFLDISENQELANQIASDSGARVVTDLYVETLSSSDGPAPTYIQMMMYDVSIIVNALL